MSLRILHVIPAVARRYGGPSVAVVGMCRALQARGFHVLLAATDADGSHRLDVVHERPTNYQEVPAIFFRRVWSEAFKWSPGLSRWAHGHVRDFDLVHVHGVFSHSALAAGSACEKAGVPYVVRPLGTLDPWSVRQKLLKKQVLFRFGVRALLGGAAAIHYTSDDERTLAERVVSGLPPGVVVPLGIDETLFADATDGAVDDVRRLVTVSRLHPKKNIDLVIDAFHALSEDETVRRWELVVAGDGDPAYVASLQERARRGPARRRISFRGWLASGEKTMLLKSSHLFVLPSEQENFGLSVAEAIACGVPVVVTPGVNLAPEIEARGAGWVTAKDAASLMATLREAMASDSERQRRGQAARALAQRFRWSAVADELGRFYASAIGHWRATETNGAHQRALVSLNV
jgi:glycosyltransferase involved in cell wall biosynthesis